jgi:ribosome maturation factor RimP
MVFLGRARAPGPRVFGILKALNGLFRNVNIARAFSNQPCRGCPSLQGAALWQAQQQWAGRTAHFFLDFMADIFALTQEALAGMAIELVDVERAPLGLLRVTIDRPEGVRIEDCEQVSKQLSRVFEVENIDYKRLEVGSPGVDRPLKRAADFVRFANERVEIKLREAVDHRKVYSGLLRAPDSLLAADATSATEFGLEFQTQSGDAQVLSFTFDDIDRAKLDPILDFKGKKR